MERIITTLDSEPVISFSILEQEFSNELMGVVCEEIAEVYKTVLNVGIKPVSYSEFLSATRIKMSNILMARQSIDRTGHKVLEQNRNSYINYEKDHWLDADASYFWIDLHEYKGKIIFRIGMNFKLDYRTIMWYNNALVKHLSKKYGKAYHVFFAKNSIEGYFAYSNGIALSKNTIGSRKTYKVSEFSKKYDYDINDIVSTADYDIDIMMAPHDYAENINQLKDIAANSNDDITNEQMKNEINGAKIKLEKELEYLKEKIYIPVKASILYYKFIKL
jgi:hypothetical protein